MEEIELSNGIGYRLQESELFGLAEHVDQTVNAVAVAARCDFDFARMHAHQEQTLANSIFRYLKMVANRGKEGETHLDLEKCELARLIIDIHDSTSVTLGVSAEMQGWADTLCAFAEL
ncbi:hypothetical protein [Saccharomonospora saliphila]|uniref:hypothetical protein n=1 Tax=Saccharomonospora saliphila TaxID=369829 RepID=UPI001E29970E|nr:hypothetical protein [Saccharomonospora saliphila]